jgi:hypothetical protein
MEVLVLPFPTRIRGSGTLTLATNSVANYAGSEGRTLRRQIIVTNLDTALDLKMRTANGIIFGTVFPRTALTWETSADVQVYNPSGAATVDYEVCEIFYDPGTPASAQWAAAPGSSGAGGGGGGGAGTGSGIGGAWGGTTSTGGRTSEP